MSDHWVTVIPQDPWFIPTIQAQQQAAEYFSQIVDDPNCVEVIVHEGIELHDCGCNLAGILCPSCDEFIDEEWWDKWTGEDYDDDLKTHSLTPLTLFNNLFMTSIRASLHLHWKPKIQMWVS
jgi:hypothetical protein